MGINGATPYGASVTCFSENEVTDQLNEDGLGPAGVSFVVLRQRETDLPNNLHP